MCLAYARLHAAVRVTLRGAHAQGVVLVVAGVIICSLLLYHNYAVLLACFGRCLRGRSDAAGVKNGTPPARPADQTPWPLPLQRSASMRSSTATLFGDPKDVELGVKAKPLARSQTHTTVISGGAAPPSAAAPKLGRTLSRSNSAH